MRLYRWVAFGIFVSMSSLLPAQSADWAVVKQLAPGQKVKLVTTEDKSLVGIVQSVSDDAIRIGKDRSVQKPDVRSVLLRSPGRRGRHALIGLGVGAGAGVGFGAATGCDVHDTNSWCFFSRREVMAVAAPLFGGLGAGVAALLPAGGKWHEVYRTP
jgi:hypothetical protein